MRCRGSSSSWHLFLLLHAPNQFKRLNTLETIIEEPNEVNFIGAERKREHRCEPSKSCEIIKNLSKSEEKSFIENVENEKIVTEENICVEQKEKSRKQWETSPDQMKEISRSLSQINGSNSETKDNELVGNKRSINEKLSENQGIRATLPPINTLSDSDSGKEYSCVCEAMYKSNSDLRTIDKTTESNQWVVSRPKRNKPKDNLRLEGSMEMETTFKTTYDTTAKQINESLSKNIAVVMPSTKLSSEENNSQELKQTNTNEFCGIKASKKKAKHRPSTSLKAGGDGYFNTVNKESYKNFVIVNNDNSRVGKAKSSTNGKKSSVCCSTVANIKLPKVDTNNREDKQSHRRMSREEKSTQMDQINRSMQRMITEDKYESPNGGLRSQTHNNFVDSSVQTNDNNITQNISNKSKIKEQKISFNAQQNKEDSEHRVVNESIEATNSWTVEGLEEHQRIQTRDIDNIKEMGLIEEPNEEIVREIQNINESDKQNKVIKELKFDSHSTNDSIRGRTDGKHYVQSQRRQKNHKNESSMRLFSGNMEFTTTTNANFTDKSPNRAEGKSKLLERERTAGKRSRKSGRKRNLFRESSEAEFNEPYGQTSTETTYQKQFGDRLYCPAIDLGSNKSEFKFRGESSGHKFFLPAVNY